MRKKISNSYRKAVIRCFDNLAPLSGELGEANGVLVKRKFFSPDEVNLMALSGPYDIRKRLSKNSFFTSLFSDYLKKWKIDTCFMWETEEGENHSSIWHHDSVGHRIKIFIGVSKKSENTGTLFIKNSYKNKYTDYLSTRVVENYDDDDIFLVNLDIGDLMVFDTNCIHSGLYGSDTRKAITVEISNPIKGFLLPGKIGKKDFRENEFFS